MNAQILTEDTVRICQRKLLEKRSEILNRFHLLNRNFMQREKPDRGDEIDLVVHQQEENTYILNQQRLREHFIEIELALGRIQSGKFGVCEETEELIELERLLAIPWTTLSIEGAEIREAMYKKYAR